MVNRVRWKVLTEIAACSTTLKHNFSLIVIIEFHRKLKTIYIIELRDWKSIKRLNKPNYVNYNIPLIV